MEKFIEDLLDYIKAEQAKSKTKEEACMAIDPFSGGAAYERGKSMALLKVQTMVIKFWAEARVRGDCKS